MTYPLLWSILQDAPRPDEPPSMRRKGGAPKHQPQELAPAWTAPKHVVQV